MKTNQSAGFFNFRLGNLTLTAVTDGHIYVKRNRPNLATASTPKEIEEAHRSAMLDKVLMDSFAPVDIVDGSINMLVVHKEDKVILIDTGFGYRGNQDVVLPDNLLILPGMVRKAGKLLENLAHAGISAADVTDIILTHAHIDHLGGILDANGNEVFQNAAIHMSQIEYDFWTSDNPDFSHSRMVDGAPAINLARYTLDKIADKLHFFQDGDNLFDCMQVIIAPGHTPGHAMLNIFSEGEELLHTVDIAYNAELVFPHPEWGANLDMDFAGAIVTRKQYFEQLAQSRKRAFGCHLPWPGLGFVQQNGNGYRWVPQNFSTPQLFDY